MHVDMGRKWLKKCEVRLKRCGSRQGSPTPPTIDYSFRRLHTRLTLTPTHVNTFPSPDCAIDRL